MAGDQRLPDDELREGARHVAYEASMFCQLAPMVDAEPDDLVASALLEAALTHGRCLVEFLYGRNPTDKAWGYPKDLWPRDWVPAWARGQAPPVSLDLIDGHISHLTRRRTGVERYQVGELRRWVVTVFGAFCARAGEVNRPGAEDHFASWRAPRAPLGRRWHEVSTSGTLDQVVRGPIRVNYGHRPRSE